MDKNPLEYRHLGAEIAKLYEEAETAVLADIMARLAMGDQIQEYHWRRSLEAQAKAVKESVKALYADIADEAADEITELLTTVYRDGYMSSPGTAAVPPKLPKEISRLIAETSLAVGHMAGPILRQVADFYRQAAGETLKTAMAQGQTRGQATQAMLNQLADRGLSGFTDKLGRQWDAASYAEMCIRTGAMKVYRSGFLDGEVADGNNLVYVSRHKGACEKCVPWEHKVLRILDV